MNEQKEYRLVTISDMVDVVTPDNIDNFLIDLKSFIQSTHNLIYLAKMIDPELADKKNSEIGGPIFNWIDDGKHEESGGLRLEVEGKTLDLPLDVAQMNTIAEALKNKK
jgi:hypothetical protein